jgi:antitoxin component YwqK of YwqJK toxin-antitoxin module
MKMKRFVLLCPVVFLIIGCGDKVYNGKTIDVTARWGNGNLKEDRISLNGDTVECISYYENFKIHTRGMVVNRNGADVKVGNWDTFYPNGRKWSLNGFSNGVTHGNYQTWHPNGTLKIIGHYSNGVETGAWKFLDSTGVVIREFDATPR